MSAVAHALKPVAGHATSNIGIKAAAATERLHIVWPGFGTCFFWQAGVMRGLSEAYDLGVVPQVGSSGGGLVALTGACGVEPEHAVRVAWRLADEAGVYGRRLGLLGVWRGLVQSWLQELLPADAPSRCAHVQLVVTELPWLTPRRLGGWLSRDDLISSALASAHIPLLLDGRPAALCRGSWVLDGNFHYAWLGRADGLVPEGPALVLDPRADPALRSRLAARGPGACVRSLGAEAALEQVALGRRWAERLASGGELEGYGLERRGHHSAGVLSGPYIDGNSTASAFASSGCAGSGSARLVASAAGAAAHGRR